MEPSTSPDSQGKNYADYVDAIRREGFVKSLKQAGVVGGPPGNLPGKDAVEAEMTDKPEPAADHAQ